jgi:chitinase
MSLKVVLLCTFSIFLGQVLTASDKVICYYASWAVTRPGNGKFVPEDIDANLCTHVNYAFLGLNNDGTLQVLDEENDVNQGGFKRVSALKEQNPNLKVLFSVGGAAADTGRFNTVADDAEKLETLTQSALELCETYNFDGLDVDWEYPRGNDQEKFIKLLTALKTVRCLAQALATGFHRFLARFSGQ